MCLKLAAILRHMQIIKRVEVYRAFEQECDASVLALVVVILGSFG